MLRLSTATLMPCCSETSSLAPSAALSKPRLYWKPLQPPPATPTRNTVSAGSFCSSMTRRISPAAFSVTNIPMSDSSFREQLLSGDPLRP